MTDFSEFQPQSWHEDGVVFAAPVRTAKTWIGTRVAGVFGVVVLLTAAVLSFDSSAQMRFAHGATMEPPPLTTSPFEVASTGNGDLVDAGYWKHLHALFSSLPTLEEPPGGDDDPLV